MRPVCSAVATRREVMATFLGECWGAYRRAQGARVAATQEGDPDREVAGLSEIDGLIEFLTADPDEDPHERGCQCETCDAGRSAEDDRAYEIWCDREDEARDERE